MYSVNQVNQLYVVKEIVAPESGETNAVLAANDNPGTLAQQFSADGWYTYFKYMSNGGMIATDRIKKRKVKWVTYTSAAKMRQPLRTWTITMNSTVNSGNPVPGQDYILNFSFRNYFGMSDEDTYEKHASARAFDADPSRLLATLAISLAKNFSREIDLPFNIAVTRATGSGAHSATTGSSVSVTPTTKLEDLHVVDNTTAANNKAVINIVLTEKIQPWQLGRMKPTRPQFTLHFVPVVINSLENYEWGEVTETLGNINTAGQYIGNGMETADMEWFFKGERADQYRGKDWPLSISTPATLMVNPTKEYNHVVVHFWDDIDNEGPQKSERDLTLVAATDDSVNLDNLAKSIAAFAGLDQYIKDGEATATSGN